MSVPQVAELAEATARLVFKVDATRFAQELRTCFVEYSADVELERFLNSTSTLRPGRVRTTLHQVLCRYLSDYDVNALLNIYPMHLLSTSQAKSLLGRASGGRLLDIGAGSGDVTRQLAPLFDEVVATELSPAMRWRLRRRGIECSNVDVSIDAMPEGPFDVIALLNVLDRAVAPQALLHRCVSALGPDSLLLVSLPLPYSPHAYLGGQTIEPASPLRIVAGDWEAEAASFVENVLGPAGLVVQRFTRLPYISGGDRRCPLYLLDALVACCRRT